MKAVSGNAFQSHRTRGFGASVSIVGAICHHVLMTSTLGIDSDELNRTGPLVVTAPIPESRLRNGLHGQRYQARQEWQKRAARGEVPEEEQPPEGPTSWTLLIDALVAGLMVAVVLGAVAQVLISGIGWMAGAHPGPYGWLVGLAAGIVTGFITAQSKEQAWERDAAFLQAHQRTITDHGDCMDMRGAARSALTVWEHWPQLRPHLPDDDQVARSRLHTALWELAGALLEHRKITDALGTARAASYRLPPGTATAHDLATQQSHAEALQRQWDTETRIRIAHLSALADQARLFAEERDAIIQARKVTSSMATALGTPTAGSQPYPEAAGELGSRIIALQAAYTDFANDIPSGN